MQNQQKSLLVSIIGKPNSGKSTLFNNIIKQDISIVTHKKNTTRNNILGIDTYKNTQIIYIDTPGIFDSKSAIDRKTTKYATNSTVGADLVCFLVDINDKYYLESVKMIEKIIKDNQKILVILNKSDLKNNYLDKILPLLNDKLVQNNILLMSALKENDIKTLKNYFLSKAVSKSWLYSDDTLTNISSRFIAQEITRKYLILNLGKELPYELKVETDLWKSLDDGSTIIYQTIYTSKNSHKKMIIGKNGIKIKEIGTKSRTEINKVLDIKCHLKLHIKIDPNWKDKTNFEDIS